MDYVVVFVVNDFDNALHDGEPRHAPTHALVSRAYEAAHLATKSGSRLPLSPLSSRDESITVLTTCGDPAGGGPVLLEWDSPALGGV